MLFRTFQKRLLLNYLWGSLAAIGNITIIFMFSNLTFVVTERITFLLVLIASMVIMFATEFTMFSFHIKPIRKIFQERDNSNESIEIALKQVKSFPILTVKRILGPHYLGLSIPLSISCYVLIKLEYLHAPMFLIIYIFAVGFLAACLHALVEFYLTLNVIQPIIAHLREQFYKESGTLFANNDLNVSIKRKLQITILLMGIIPVIIFMLASLIKFLELLNVVPNSYWLLSLIVLTTCIIYSLSMARYMYRDIKQPINDLLEKMQSAQHNDYQFLEKNVYTDEFSQLISGFNHMIKGIKSRDVKANQLLQSFIFALTAALDARDPNTAGHSSRVATLSKEIGMRMGLTSEELEKLYKSGTLHDIGKIGVPDYILLKEEQLTVEEFSQIKAHTVIGENILKQISPQDDIADLLPGVRSHHERMDGKGYPDGLKGSEIPLNGRILAVADAFDAMTSDRPYRTGMSIEKAVAILLDGRDTQWDREVVSAFIQHMEESGGIKIQIKITS